MQIGQAIIINLACTGVIPTKAMNPYVPISHHEIIDDVARSIEQGVQMVHLHARDAKGIQTADPEPYARLVEAIRSLPDGPSLIIGLTTSARIDNSFESRSRVLDLDGDAKPDMASLTLSSMNFVQSASINQPDIIRKLAQRMKERGIKPELEVFDIGMANFVKVLLNEGLIEAPLYVNVLLGNISGAQPNLLQLASVLSALPEGCIVSVAGLGRFQLSANSMGILCTDGVRVGLEDNLWFDQKRTIYASNLNLVQRVIAQAALVERSVLDRNILRERMGLSS
jgi:uncharacterized protein (DUF849 family)